MNTNVTENITTEAEVMAKLKFNASAPTRISGRLACIAPRGGDLGSRAGLGDIVTASVKEAAPDSNIKKGKVVRCVIVRMRKESRRKDGTYIRFDSNAAVLVNELGEPVGTRVFGPVARELREKKYMKIVSLAPEVI